MQNKAIADLGRERRNLKTKSKDQVLIYLANDGQSALAIKGISCSEKCKC